jgi:hypothetical protein
MEANCAMDEIMQEYEEQNIGAKYYHTKNFNATLQTLKMTTPFWTLSLLNVPPLHQPAA